MKTLLFFIFCSLLLVTQNNLAQESKLYTPLNIQWAYENETRSADGKPGPGYWINKSLYDISVELVPETKMVIGSESVKYFNNSPDSLDMIVIRLYQDFYKKGNMRDWGINPNSINDGVVLTKIKIDGREINLNQTDDRFNRYGTNLYINLDNKLLPNSSLNLEIDWYYEISSIFPLRMGSYNDSTFMVAYWYPQIAVYDDISGWDTFNYEGTTEFYNDFNDYTVNITVPHEFVVWATGVMQNPSQVLSEKIFERYTAAYHSDEIINIITAEDKNITAPNDKNTWTYKADHVPDFVFAAAKGYLWDASSLVVDNATGRRTFVSAAYNRASKDFYEVTDIARKTIDHLSQDFPGIPFPYPEMTVFNGRGGMEYPMMVNDGSFDDRSRVVQITSHEITHSYFPFYTGTNERKYAWMDEGWAVMLPLDLQEELEPGYEPRIIYNDRYTSYSGLEFEVPPMVSSTLLSSTSYRTAAYNRPALAYDILRDYLGKETFKKALAAFVERWNGKHPMPYDFFYTFNDITGEDLSWYWKPWFFEFGYPDLAIDDVISGDEELKIVVKKKGNIPVPVEVKVTYENGELDTVKLNAGAWKNGNTETTVSFKTGNKPLSVELGNLSIPDVDLKNNSYFGNID
ncbi:M1 family metallopeptidase [Bacteroidota bacterium]